MVPLIHREPTAREIILWNEALHERNGGRKFDVSPIVQQISSKELCRKDSRKREYLEVDLEDDNGNLTPSRVYFF